MEPSTAAALSRPEEVCSPHPRYRLLERIGQGSMGEVWRAHDRPTEQIVALKRVRVPAREPSSPRLDEPYEKSGLAQAATVMSNSLRDQAPRLERALTRLTPAFAQLAMTMTGSSFALPPSAESVALRLHLTQEFRTLASLRHPHIVSVLDYGFNRENQPYFTMEFLGGATPLDETARGQPLTVRIGMLLQTLQALTYLHRRGVLHREKVRPIA